MTNERPTPPSENRPSFAEVLAKADKVLLGASPSESEKCESARAALSVLGIDDTPGVRATHGMPE